MSALWTGRCRPQARPVRIFGTRPVVVIVRFTVRGLALRPSPTQRLEDEP